MKFHSMFPLKGDLSGLFKCIHTILFSNGWPLLPPEIKVGFGGLIHDML